MIMPNVILGMYDQKHFSHLIAEVSFWLQIHPCNLTEKIGPKPTMVTKEKRYASEKVTFRPLTNKNRSTKLRYLNTLVNNPMKLYATVEVNNDQELLMNQCHHPGKIEFDKSWWTRRWNLRTDSIPNQIRQSPNAAIPIQDTTVLQDIEPTHQLGTHGPGYLGETATNPGSDVDQPNVAIPIQDTMVLQDIKPTQLLGAHGPSYLGDSIYNQFNMILLEELWQVLPPFMMTPQTPRLMLFWTG